jgi:hypothetical protein
MEKTPGMFPDKYGLWIINEIRPIEHYSETLQGSMMAARKHKDWSSYLHSGYTKHS